MRKAILALVTAAIVGFTALAARHRLKRGGGEADGVPDSQAD